MAYPIPDPAAGSGSDGSDHDIGDHADATATTTGANLTTLTDGSYANGLHAHQEITIPCRKASVGTINIGQVVYLAGWNAGLEVHTVELAKADAAATMPAIGIAKDSITNSTTGDVSIVGHVNGFNTSSFSVKDPLYVSAATAGALTATKPAGATNLIQKVAVVLRANVTLGEVLVVGAGRSNDVPNLTNGSIWVGDGSNHAAEKDKPAFLDDKQAWTATQYNTPQAFSWSGGAGSWNPDSGNEIIDQVEDGGGGGGAITINAPSNTLVAGTQYNFVIQMDSTGNNAITFNGTAFNFGARGAPTTNTLAANKYFKVSGKAISGTVMLCEYDTNGGAGW